MNLPINPEIAYRIETIAKMVNYSKNVVSQIRDRAECEKFREGNKIINLQGFLKVFYSYKPRKEYKGQKVKPWKDRKRG